jgi:hypothetical protein
MNLWGEKTHDLDVMVHRNPFSKLYPQEKDRNLFKYIEHLRVYVLSQKGLKFKL